MLQLGALCDSVNRREAERRSAYVVDTAVGAQGDSRGLKQHLAALRKSVGLPDPGEKNAADFLRDFGGGI